jgi:hypothetical protein
MAMCHFITAVIGSKADTKSLNVIATRYHRWFSPIENESVRPFLLPGEIYYSTTPRKAYCDCGTQLGWA